MTTFPFSRFPDFPKLLAEVGAKKVTNYNVIYIIIYLYIYKYIIILLLVGKNQFREIGKSGNLHFSGSLSLALPLGKGGDYDHDLIKG